MKKNKNMNLEEASEFWDDHDLFEFSDIKEEKELSFQLSKKKYIGVDETLYLKISRQAKKQHTTPDNLINHWLKQKAGASSM